MFSALLPFKGSIRHCLFVLLFFSLLFTLFFSPTLFHDSLLAPGGSRLGDGLLYHLTFFQSKKIFWDNLLAGGFPMTADPQVMAWYPPALLLSLLPGTWNIFVVSAYVMASCFTYGYVFALTESKLASLVSGVIYGMCGFMVAHLGHTAILHAAVWLPLIIWSLEMLRRKFSPGWLAVGCFAVACCVLAGHLQIVVYTLLLSICYLLALGWTAPAGRKRYYLVASLLLLIGVGLAALQIFPTVELAGLSTRSEFGFSDFVSYSFPLKQIPLLFFPAAFGGLSHYGTTPYFGEWNLTELTGYVGLLPLMLSAIGLIVSRRKAISIFWLCAGVVAFLLALGDQTPLAYLTYHLPVFGKFRAPARHFIEMALAASVLAGIGVEGIVRKTATPRLLLKTVSGAALLMLAGLLFLVLKHSTEYVVEGSAVRPETLAWVNPAIWTPLVVFLAAALTLLYWHRNADSFPRKILLLFVLVLDIASFGWFYSWHDYSPRRSILSRPPFVAHYQDLLRATNQRLLSVRGTLGTTSEIPPNLSRLWEVPSASGYSPLSLSRVIYLLSMLPDASVDTTWKNPLDQSLNLAAVRYVFLPRTEALRDERGVLWSQENMSAWLGSGCNQPPNNSIKLELPAPIRATAIGIVSRLVCSVSLPDGAEVVRILLTDADGSVATQSLLVGRDTSEWTYDSSNITPQIKHQRAAIFSNLPAQMDGKPYEAHNYVALLKLDGIKDIRSLEFQWTGQFGAISIEKVSLVNELAQTSDPVNPLSTESSRWRFVEEAGEARIYENLHAMPRAWLVPEAITLKPDEIITAIKTSRLPDGRIYNPLRMALIEVPSTFTAQKPDEAGSARIVRLNDTVMEVQTSSSFPAFLLTSDVYYPGWEASVDGVQAQLFVANYAFRGVKLPGGTHLVRFTFKPKSFYYGVTISAFSLAILAGFLFLPRIFVRRVNPNLIS